MRLVNGSELGRLRIQYERITVYKITVPSAKNDVYRTGRFYFDSARRLVDGVDICRELYDHALSTSLLPDDPFFSMRSTSSCRQVLTYAVMRQAVKAAVIQLTLAAHWWSMCVAGSGCAHVDDIIHGEMEVSTGVFERIRSCNGLPTDARCVIHCGCRVIAYEGGPVGNVFEHLR